MNKSIAAAAGMLVLAGACSDPLNAPNEDQVLAGTAQPIQNLVTGVLAQDRSSAGAFSYLLYPEGLARNALRPDPNEPRYVGDLIGTQTDPSNFIGSSGWNGYFTTIRAVNQVLVSPSTTAIQDPGDKSALIGLVQSIKGLEYLRLVQLRDTLGIAIQTDAINTPDPLRTKTSVLAYVSQLLDSANTSLTTAGKRQVPVTLPSGYRINGNFTWADTLAKFNRGLKGETEVYRLLDHQNPCTSCAATAITALNAALAGIPQTQAGLNFGPYYEFNPNAPESFPYPLADPRIYVTDNFVQSATPGDARLNTITQSSTPSVTNGGLAAPLTYKSSLTLSTNQTRPLPIRRAAFWYMLRAQAEAESGQLAQAAADVNVVRTVEGGLPPVAPFTSVAQARAAILYEYRYSFLFQGPYYLVALREYSALTRAYVSQAGMPTIKTDPNHTSDPLQTTLPIPQNESVARGGNVTPVP
jgi:hypothetical protein